MRIGVSGHRDIPLDALSFITSGITQIIGKVKSGLVGITSLAEGADQLFAWTVLNHGGVLHVIVPCEGYEGTFSSEAQRETFVSLARKASYLEKLRYPTPSEAAFLDAGRRIVDLSDLLVAVWDGKPARGKGGTGDIVEYARSKGTDVHVLWPSGVSR